LLEELFYILKIKGDIKAIATAALREFGTFRSVLSQKSSNLRKIEGLTANNIKRLNTLYSLFKEFIRPDSYLTHTNPKYEDLSYFILTSPKFDGETLRLLFLDESKRIINDLIIKKGFGNHVKLYHREIAKEVLKAGISNIVLIHHKLISSPTPSLQDKKSFTELQMGLKGLDIKLVDYLIISQNTAFSFIHNKLFAATP
ncbi:MAG: hypothetical protein FJX71_04290, partial [Alphaproteobacteria bacterium]|nr:hypothetical protein [Alphaproteobacteria bacterium]